MNVLEHSTGALNIDACRISTSESLSGGAYSVNAKERHDGAENWRMKSGAHGGLAGKDFQQPPGRWPSNLILQHLDGCERDGFQAVRGAGHYPTSRPAGSTVSGPAGHRGQTGLVERILSVETTERWHCLLQCPVATLDGYKGGTATSNGLYEDGGVSRFFKQMGWGSCG